MSYFYATECAKFKTEFEKFRQEATAAGMSEQDIQAMYETDLHQFNRDRSYITHTQPLDRGSFSDGDEADRDQSPLLKKHLESMSVSMAELFSDDRCGWVENLADDRFAGLSRALSPKDIELLSYIAADGFSQAEIARELGVTRAAVRRHLNRIKEKLEKTHRGG